MMRLVLRVKRLRSRVEGSVVYKNDGEFSG